MVNETAIQARLRQTEQQLEAIHARIGPLQQAVSCGSAGWEAALEALAFFYKRRRALEAERESLHWVLAPEQ